MHNSKNCCTFAPGNSICHNLKKDHETTSPRRRGVFFVAFFCFYVVNMIKNQKKIKKNQKNAKKLQKNLHISKKSCTFAPSNEKDANK